MNDLRDDVRESVMLSDECERTNLLVVDRLLTVTMIVIISRLCQRRPSTATRWTVFRLKVKTIVTHCHNTLAPSVASTVFIAR